MGSGKVATVAELTIGAPQTALNLTMFPLSGNPACSLDYLLVDARSPKSAAATKAKLSSVLKEISTSLFEKYEPVGVGEDWRYDGKLSFGKALHYGEELVHLSAFRK